MTNEEIDEQIRYLNEELIPYKSLGLSEREQQIKLDMLLEEIIRLRNLKKWNDTPLRSKYHNNMNEDLIKKIFPTKIEMYLYVAN